MLHPGGPQAGVCDFCFLQGFSGLRAVRSPNFTTQPWPQDLECRA